VRLPAISAPMSGALQQQLVAVRSSDTLGAVRRLGYLRPEARGSFLRSAGAVLYFDNSSAFPRSIQI
jgi:hypothetical protein